MSAVKKTNSANGSKLKANLRVVKGGLYPYSKREILIENLWLFCQASLWNTQLFSDDEITEFKALLSEHFKGSKNNEKTFKHLVERVCLAKRYLARRKGRYISKPIDWLNINYKNGLTGTAGWFAVVEEQRKTVPRYNEGISLLAKAVYKYCDKKNVNEVLQFRKELIQLKQHDLVQTYMNTIMHIQYFNF